MTSAGRPVALQIRGTRHTSRGTRHALKILILKPSSLGDVVQAIPVLRLLKLHWPDSEIFWWIEATLSPLLEEDPDLTGVVRFNRRGWALPANWPEVWHSVRWMRRQSFDLVIDLQCLLRQRRVCVAGERESFSWVSTSRGKARAGSTI